jgi:hypothetical protein
MALVSTQPVTEMSTRNLPGGKGRAVRKADNLTAICEPIVWKMWESRLLLQDSFTFTFIQCSCTLIEFETLRYKKILTKPNFMRKSLK